MITSLPPCMRYIEHIKGQPLYCTFAFATPPTFWGQGYSCINTKINVQIVLKFRFESSKNIKVSSIDLSIDVSKQRVHYSRQKQIVLIGVCHGVHQ